MASSGRQISAARSRTPSGRSGRARLTSSPTQLAHSASSARTGADSRSTSSSMDSSTISSNRTTSRPATLRKLAAALGVPVDALLGTLPAPHSRDVDVAPLRRAITADASIPGLEDLADTRELLPLPELTASAHAAWRAYVDG